MAVVRHWDLLALGRWRAHHDPLTTYSVNAIFPKVAIPWSMSSGRNLAKERTMVDHIVHAASCMKCEEAA